MDWSARNCSLVKGYNHNGLVGWKLSATERSVDITTMDWSARNCSLVKGYNHNGLVGWKLSASEVCGYKHNGLVS